MTADERTGIAEQLLAVMFSLRPDNSEAGQAWTLTVATTAVARAILGSVGPQGDPEDLLNLSAHQVREMVTSTQSEFFRKTLTHGRPA
jgi:hypothetical protein